MPASERQADLAAPSPTNWRRQRLLRIGSSSALSTSPRASFLRADRPSFPSYGTLPTHSRRPVSFLVRRNLPALPTLLTRHESLSIPTSPLDDSPDLSPISFRELAYWSTQRPISAYDAPISSNAADMDTDLSARTNGIRVWYSSFSSIDWLHDAVKDRVRHSKLRKRKSLRAWTRLTLDKSVGWFIVTLVGFMTALVAFLIVRGEQWLFDMKDGYCSDNWRKAKRFCCPRDVHFDTVPLVLGLGSEEKPCEAWRTWGEVFTQSSENNPGWWWTIFEREFVEYISYTTIAVVLAVTSSLLTIYLTASTSFVTRKESGVLAPDFPAPPSKQPNSSVNEPKRKVLYYAAGSGIPEIKTILSGFVIHGYLGGRTLFTKSLGLALSVASGLSLGKEGPFVHIASCIGNIVSRFFSKYENNEAKRREILSAACAAGVAVAFGAPIGGVLFSLEEVSYFFPPKVMWRSFFCAMIAAITLRALDPFGTGKLVLFQVTYDKDWHAVDLVFFLILGLFGGLYGAYFSKLNIRWSRNVRNGTSLKNHPVAEVLMVTLVTTVLCFLNPYTRMGGTELVYNLFRECHHDSSSTHSGLCVADPGSLSQVLPVVQAILVAMVVKGALTVVTFGIKVPAGIFIPTLGVGACAGRVLGIAVQWSQWVNPSNWIFAACKSDKNCVIPGLYAMVGAAATLSGVTRTTVSLAVIMFELTDTLTYAVPVMLAVLVAKTVADALEPKGIYDLVIDLSQLPFLNTKNEYSWSGYQIGDVTDHDAQVIRLDMENTVESLRDQLQALLCAGHDDTGFPILRNDKHDEGLRMIGYIGASELEHALSIVAEDASQHIRFHTTYAHDMTTSVSSLTENGELNEIDLCDFSLYMDQAPLTIQSNAPLELVHQFFLKLGARYVVVTDTEGYYEGVIDKKRWLAFLNELEKT